ncbi:hypothetical protein GY45DRAFT_107898 [Cubamyces sp. BRFM 1775]|nr:hypothetical protein GY45DRAFT_107898 [Cubamyces sp. BRFM 1775]
MAGPFGLRSSPARHLRRFILAPRVPRARALRRRSRARAPRLFPFFGSFSRSFPIPLFRLSLSSLSPPPSVPCSLSDSLPLRRPSVSTLA